MTQIDWLLSHGFNEEGISYCIYGDNTYAIKEYLKNEGCKYDPVFKWHAAMPVNLPEGYGYVEINYRDYMEWDNGVNTMLYYEDTNARFDRLIQEAMGPSTSEYYDGEVGDRVQNLTAVYKSHRGYQGMYGYTNIYTFNSGDYVLVWFTTTTIEAKLEDAVDISFTIKDFEEFRGVKTTKITRAKIKVIGG